jgi:hypothetical protein
MLDDVEDGGEYGPAARRRHAVHGQVAAGGQVQRHRLGPGGAVGGQVRLGQNTAHLGLKGTSIFPFSEKNLIPSFAKFLKNRTLPYFANNLANFFKYKKISTFSKNEEKLQIFSKNIHLFHFEVSDC